MLGGVVVAELDRLIQVGALDDQRVGDALADDLNSRKRQRLRLDLDLDGRETRLGNVDGEEDDLRVRAMLGLTEKVGSDKGRVGVLVRNDLSFDAGQLEHEVRQHSSDVRGPHWDRRACRWRSTLPSPSKRTSWQQ